MKKFLFFQMIFFFMFPSLKGQQYSIGFKPSFLLVNARSSHTYGTSYAIGFSINDQINKKLGLKIEPRFIVKGYNTKWYDEVDKFRNQYLSFPLIFYYTPGKNLNLEFGPDICFLLYALEKTSSMNSWSRQVNTWDFKKIEFSLISGISYTLKRFDIGTRYGFGLTPFQYRLKKYPTGPLDLKIFQSYFEFYVNTRLHTKIKNN